MISFITFACYIIIIHRKLRLLVVKTMHGCHHVSIDQDSVRLSARVIPRYQSKKV